MLVSSAVVHVFCVFLIFFFFFQAEDGIRDLTVTGVQTCALPILPWASFLRPVGGALRFVRSTTMAVAAELPVPGPSGPARTGPAGWNPTHRGSAWPI